MKVRQIRDKSRGLGVATPVPSAEHTAQLQGFLHLESLHANLAEAQRQLEAQIGVPICVDGCGRCCLVNTPPAWGVEVEYAVQWLVQQPADKREKILDRCRQWLELPVLEERAMGRSPARIVRRPERGPRPLLTDAMFQQMRPELEVAERGTCPMLDTTTMACMIHEVRPLACRTYGVTHLPQEFCPRPEGAGENATTRGIVEGDPARLMFRQTQAMLTAVRGYPRLADWEFLPTGLLRRFRPDVMDRIQDAVPTAKLLSGQHLAAALFEAQIDRANETGMFVTPSAGGPVGLRADALAPSEKVEVLAP